ncbi:alpha-L-rhamnosidase [Ampelomyces quisqualis]|uniref:Alpha-L-rhamnosidase n=1 Tax=Ampelomyces quisqualis TaxID=50730 RepID=A0A6A5R0Y4_AMPQU|nr:alpha-L-rhamnosidase [Ampelomyces quisqualis]
MKLLSVFTALVSTASCTPYSQYILAPKSRTLHPVSIHSSNNTLNPENLLSSCASNSSAVFSGPAATAYDFGINIAGLVSLSVSSTSSSTQRIGVTFSESSLWVSNSSSDATALDGKDEPLWFDINSAGTYTAPRAKERGAFRYLTLVHDGEGSVDVQDVQVWYTAMPHWADDALGEYTGWFHCDDDLLNRIWYAGAYTNQLCTIDPSYGNALVHLQENGSSFFDAVNVTWWSNATITEGKSALVDGAKRDRLVWAGDMSIAVPAVVVSTNDVISIENSLNSLFALQNSSTGQLPYAGRPFPTTLSFTYHLYTLIGVADHYLYTGNITYLTTLWPQFKFALSFSLSFIDSTNLMNVTSPFDWLRFGMGGHNIEANAILYHTLNQAISLASALNDTAPIPSWTTTASSLKTAANTLLWDNTAGLYRDNETTSLHPQDGNAWAVLSNLTYTPTQAYRISSGLQSRWTPFGAPAPEAADAISPFISGFELQTHFSARRASAALALMRLQWGFMLDDPRMTNSSFIEGYSTSGDLRYAPYVNDARISHAHGWATGPTASLSSYVAGLQVVRAGGAEWKVAPQMGGLRRVDAGFETGVGRFRVQVDVGERRVDMEFETPEGTAGEVTVPRLECEGRVVMQNVEGGCGDVVVEVAAKDVGPVSVADVKGGKWKVAFTCSE